MHSPRARESRQPPLRGKKRGEIGGNRQLLPKYCFLLGQFLSILCIVVCYSRVLEAHGKHMFDICLQHFRMLTFSILGGGGDIVSPELACFCCGFG